MLAVDTVRLTEAHRLAQARLGAQMVRASLDVWPLLDPADLNGSFPGWLRALRPLVDVHRATSAQLAANYMTMARTVELAEVSTPAVALAGQVPLEQLTASMLATGPASIRHNLAGGVQAARALEVAKARTSAAAMRLALNGGRETIVGSVHRDKKALGWARATSGAACAFCRMLASRGPVYKGQASADFAAHDGCGCSAKPVYSREAPWPAGSLQHKDLWNQSTKGKSGKDALNAFRRAIAVR